MHIFVIGTDHTAAPIALRERLACSQHQAHQLLGLAHEVVQEVVLLATCNRLELYAVCPELGGMRANLLHVLSETSQVALSELEVHCYDYADEQSVLHLFAVASGLHSLVPGEAQIQGQVAEALELAQSAGCAGPIISALFRAALIAGKRARSETGISRSAASVSHVAVQLARQLFPCLNEACVLLVGSGKMSELAARNLCDNGAQHLIVINRTREHGLELTKRFGAVHRPFTELATTLVEADVVISSTTSPHAIITHDMVQRAMQQRAGRPLLLIDIALPRDVEPSVINLAGVHLYNLDDLQAHMHEGIRLRLQEKEHVQAIVAEEASSFERWLRSLSVVATISDLRRRADTVRQQELARALRHLSQPLSERESAVVQELTSRLVNKLLHTPTLRLKDAAAAGQGQVYDEALRYLFDLEGEDEDHHQRDES